MISANEFLTRVNLMGGDRFPDIDTPVGIGTDVVVIGAGNTAMDCMRVARRLGADVRCVYRRSRAEAPARAEELRHAEEEGVQFLFLHNPVEGLSYEAGLVRGLRVERMELGEPDERGRRRPTSTGEISDIVCDTVVVALGTNPNPILTRNTAGLALDDRGYVAADPVSQATNLPGVFAGGDIVTGGATVTRVCAARAAPCRGVAPVARSAARGSRSRTAAAPLVAVCSRSSTRQCQATRHSTTAQSTTRHSTGPPSKPYGTHSRSSWVGAACSLSPAQRRAISFLTHQKVCHADGQSSSS